MCVSLQGKKGRWVAAAPPTPSALCKSKCHDLPPVVPCVLGLPAYARELALLAVHALACSRLPRHAAMLSHAHHPRLYTNRADLSV